MEKEFEQIDDTIETPLEINIEEFLAEEPPVIEVETEAVVDNPAPEPVIESEVVAPVAEVVTPVAEVVAIQPEEKPVPFTTTQPAKKSNRSRRGGHKRAEPGNMHKRLPNGETAAGSGWCKVVHAIFSCL